MPLDELMNGAVASWSVLQAAAATFPRRCWPAPISSPPRQMFNLVKARGNSANHVRQDIWFSAVVLLA